ncbi:MAG: hypothetical protein U9N46_05145 [Euryarchaeota archaeon]|nr:hypothetical protein [Euryarchaeota archaeon]
MVMRPAASDAPCFTAGGMVGTKVATLADRPMPGPHRVDVNDRASKQPELSPIWVQLKSQSPDGKHSRNRLSQTPKATPQHTRTANTSPLHQTALSYETAVSDGGRLELKTQGIREKPVLLAAQESRAIPAEASESAPGLWDDPIDDPGLERFCPIGRDKRSRFRSHYLYSADRTDSEKLLRGLIGNV